MDYEEFRWALGDQTSVPLLQQAFAAKQPLGDAAHRKIMRDLRLYMLVGGMPQAVNTNIARFASFVTRPQSAVGL